MLRDTFLERCEFCGTHIFVDISDVRYDALSISRALRMGQHCQIREGWNERTVVGHFAMAPAKLDIGFVGFFPKGIMICFSSCRRYWSVLCAEVR